MRRLLLAAALLALAWPGAAAALRCDLALVLLADASGSIDDQELEMQLSGTAAGVEDPAVVHGLTDGSHGRSAVVFGLWSVSTAWGTPWTIVESQADARRLAQAIRESQAPARLSTDIAQALWAAGRKLDEIPCAADRIVVDVSGDGVHNTRADLAAARDALDERGATVNGLVIVESGDHGLQEFYEGHVVTGLGAFVIRADGMRDFARAIRVKILREVAGR